MDEAQSRQIAPGGDCGLPVGAQGVPAHLRHHVVQQDYARYDEVDQAVWRFILLHTYGQLRDCAHPAYAEGFGRAGMRVERIPRVQEMDRALSRFGWSAVCVDGFIPPRAFQELQANAILPIAAEIRRSNHLAYTPAPDIVHEAAGHAPLIADADYAAFLRRIGEVGQRAFSLPEDRAVDAAVRTLSVAKERESESSDAMVRAQAALAEALAAVDRVSEAAQVTRLHWWTVEYGLVGTMDAPRLYGAGLLSSLGEGHACLRGGARHRPLGLDCVEVPFDITRPQPQLFVVPSLRELLPTVDALAARLAQQLGGDVALRHALQSGELATLRFDDGLDVMGTVAAVSPPCSAPISTEGARPGWVRIGGGPAVADANRLLLPPDAPAPLLPVLPLGPLKDGRTLSRQSPSELASALTRGGRGLRFASGVQLRGRLLRHVAADGRPRMVQLAAAELTLGSQVLFRSPAVGGHAVHTLPLTGALRGVVAGATRPDYHRAQPTSDTRVPAERVPSGRTAALDALYARGRGYRAREERDALRALHRSAARYPRDWLLRWNLLESLLALGVDAPEVDALAAELRALEVAYAHREPIALGLRTLGLDAA